MTTHWAILYGIDSAEIHFRSFPLNRPFQVLKGPFSMAPSGSFQGAYFKHFRRFPFALAVLLLATIPHGLFRQPCKVHLRKDPHSIALTIVRTQMKHFAED